MVEDHRATEAVLVCFDPDTDPVEQEFAFFERHYREAARKKAGELQVAPRGRYQFRAYNREILNAPRRVALGGRADLRRSRERAVSRKVAHPGDQWGGPELAESPLGDRSGRQVEAARPGSRSQAGASGLECSAVPRVGSVRGAAA